MASLAWLFMQTLMKIWFPLNWYCEESTLQSEIFCIMITNDVLQFPWSESYNILVNFESLYGICSKPCDNDWTTCPRQDNDELIFFASSKVSPLAPVFATFSEPAKSTRFNLTPLFNYTVKIRWLLELDELNLVSATWRLSSAKWMSSLSYDSFSTVTLDKRST